MAGCQVRGPRGSNHPQAKNRGGRSHNKVKAWSERGGVCQGRGSALANASSKSVKLLEERIEAKVKFSQFLDEVTTNVLDSNSLQAFGKLLSPSSSTTTLQEEKMEVLTQKRPKLPCSEAKQQSTLLKPKIQKDLALSYEETDIDTVRKDGKMQDQEAKVETPVQSDIDKRHVIPPPPQFCQGFAMKSPLLEFHQDLFPRSPYRSASLPRGINMVSDETQPQSLISLLNICHDCSRI